MTKTDAKICGMGHSMKRKEDPRFIRGQGNYVDDIQLPGMLYMDIVRSPHAHAKIKKINTDRGAEDPGRAGGDRPADAREVQAALDADHLGRHADGAADRRGHVPGAGGVRGDRHRALHRRRRRRRGRGRVRAAAGDGRSAKSIAPGAPVLRNDKKDKKDNLAFHWEAGDRAATDKALAAPTWWWSSTSICRASTSLRWRPAAASPTSTPRRASSRST